MAAAAATGPSSSALGNINDSKKRWMVFGLALKDLVDQIRCSVEKEVKKDYDNLKTSHGIDSQSSIGRLERWSSTFLKYENINGNDAVPKLPRGKFNYAACDCRVMSHVDYAKLYLESYMAKFTVFDEHCDASAVLNLLGRVLVFSPAVQSAAHDIRHDRNAWAHCAFQDWDPAKLQQCFQDMEKLVKALGLPAVVETKLLTDLNIWETTGPSLCMNASLDPALLQMVQQHVNKLIADVDKMMFEVDCDRETVTNALQDVAADVKELEKRISAVETKQIGTDERIGTLEQQVTQVEEQLQSSVPQINFEISNFESDIAFFAERHDPDTREWLFGDIDTWFYAPGDSRAYVLLGDAGVGKSVIAGALAKRAKDAGYLGAAYFCHYKDETRNDPKILLGTIACQLCKCSVQYSNEVGGEGGVRMTLADNKLSILGLFTKLLQEPLGKCTPCEQRKLVIIDALDETEYKSRDDFLDLVMHRFPRLPKWLLFFITSRPEDTVQYTLENYNPCIRICAGNDKHCNVYHQHEQDIKRYLGKNIDFSRLQFSVEEITKTCSGLFLYAFYMVGVLNDPIRSDNIGQLTHIFPGNISNFFQKNFERIYARMGAELFRTLFGCVVAAPSPIPLSLISFLLKREGSILDEQEVIDTVSIFLVLHASDQTLSFLHNLIPSWLTDKKRARRFFVDTTKAGEYLREIVLEFLPSMINVTSSEKHSSIELDLLDYALHIGVRLLCKYDDRKSTKIIYECLTSYQYIQKRIQKSWTGVYSVIGDLKLSARCQTLCNAEKEILQGICRALEKDIHTLFQCPHLLPFCLLMASKAVKSNIAIPLGVFGTTWMEWSWLSYPVFKATCGKVRSCFAFSPDRSLLAEVKDGRISLYNSCSLERLLGPVEAKELEGIKHLAFSPCGNFVFFGKFDKAFSVERGGIETYFPLQTDGLLFEWSSFTLDRQHIVVKCKSLLTPTCWLCLLNHLCLWAKLEIERSGKREPLCRCFPHKLQVTRKYPQLESPQGLLITAMRLLLNLLSKMKCKEWCSLLEKVQFHRGDETFLVSDCDSCKTAEEYEALTLEEVRQFVIDHYSEIFRFQVWDTRTGKPALNVAFSSDVEVSPFIHFCHLGTALEECETLFTGIEKALSFSNVALLSIISHHLLFLREFTSLLKKDYLSSRSSFRDPLNKWDMPLNETVRSFSRDKKGVFREVKCSACVDEDVVHYMYFANGPVHALCLNTNWMALLYNTRTYNEPLFHWFDLTDQGTYGGIERALALLTVSPTIASELENLPDEGKKEFFSDSIPCFSPGGVWVAKLAVYNDERIVSLVFGRHAYRQQHSDTPVHVFEDVDQFAFTNDHLYFVYLSQVHNSLHILSLQSGTVLHSVSGVSPLLLVPKGQAGFHFQANNEDKSLFLKDFPCGFLKHFLIPSVKKPMQANFVSDDTFLVLCTDSSVLSFQATGDLCTKTIFAEPSLDFGLLGPWHVKKCAFSSDGKLIAAHHGNMITLHDTIESDDCRFPCSVFKADYEFSVLQLTFSVDNAFLLFCIRNCPFVVWDVKKRETLASFDPLGLVSEDFCCCFTVCNRIVLCSELYIEIWDLATSTSYPSTRLAIDVLYSEADKITYCTLSRNNDLLACCVVDRILVFLLNAPTNQPVLKLPRAHLGKIEFCRFLKGNRHIISYGIDGAVFLWDLHERTAISFIRMPQERENITFMTVSPKEDKVVGCTSFGRFFGVKLFGLKSEMPSFQLKPQGMVTGHNASIITGGVCYNVEQIAAQTDTSKVLEEMYFMYHSDHSEDSDGDESESSETD